MLDLVLRKGEAIQAELPRVLDLSQPSVARLVAGFVTEKMVETAARTPVGRGNPSVALRLVGDYAFGFGVGIAGDALSIALVDFAGAVRGERRIAVADMSRRCVLDRLPALRADLIAASGIDEARIVGSGVGFSGFVVAPPCRFNPPAMLADWLDTDLFETLAPLLGPNLLFDNDATCAAIAESLLGVGRTIPTFAYCHLTNGFGGGLIVDGRPMRGALGNAGDFGAVWWLLNRGYPDLDRLLALVADGGNSFATVDDMLPAIEPETPGVSAWLAEAAEPFATLTFLLGHIVAPERVVIGGRLPAWLAEALAALIVLPQSPTRHERPFPLPAVVPREVDGNATAIGAALMPLQALFFR